MLINLLMRMLNKILVAFKYDHLFQSYDCDFLYRQNCPRYLTILIYNSISDIKFNLYKLMVVDINYSLY